MKVEVVMHKVYRIEDIHFARISWVEVELGS